VAVGRRQADWPFNTLAKWHDFPRLTVRLLNMDLNYSHLILALAPSAQPGQQGSAQAWTGLVPLILLMVVFYFVLIRPQQKKAKQHAEMLKTIKPGDKIVTSGGLIGVVLTVKEKGGVTIRSADAKLEITRSAVAEITERGGEKSES
jgi:preprotein translocase subunit YajC